MPGQGANELRVADWLHNTECRQHVPEHARTDRLSGNKTLNEFLARASLAPVPLVLAPGR